jgi:hypothetical protein
LPWYRGGQPERARRHGRRYSDCRSFPTCRCWCRGLPRPPGAAHPQVSGGRCWNAGERIWLSWPDLPSSSWQHARKGGTGRISPSASSSAPAKAQNRFAQLLIRLYQQRRRGRAVFCKVVQLRGKGRWHRHRPALDFLCPFTPARARHHQPRVRSLALQVGGLKLGKLTDPSPGHCCDFDQKTELRAVAIGRGNDQADGVFGQNDIARLFGVRDGGEPGFPGAAVGDPIIMLRCQIERCLKGGSRTVHRRRCQFCC